MSDLLVALRILAALLSYLSIGGAVPPNAGAIERAEWIGDPQPAASPACGVDAKAWFCWGVPRSNGIVVLQAPDSLWWGVMGSDATPVFRPARWARLLVISTAAARPSELRITFRRPVAPPPLRFRAFRLDTATVPGASATSLAPNTIWVAGDALPAESWIEITSDQTPPAYLALPEIAAAPVSVPLHVTLREPRLVRGRALAGGDQPAPGTLVTVFRLIDPPAAGRNAPSPRRVLASELTAGEDGRFVLEALGEADYEAVAWHGQLGRAAVPIGRSDTEVVARLRSSGLVRGRVLAGGKPIEGVDVVSVPDAAAFGAAGDMIDVKGGDTRTRADGTFAVAVASSGGGELRVGGGAYPVRRIPLPRPPLPLFEAGDIDLGLPIDLVISIDVDPGCPLIAAGPIGRTGLQIVPARRTESGRFAISIPEPGSWEFSLNCQGNVPSLSPSVIQIGPAQSGKEVRLQVRD